MNKLTFAFAALLSVNSVASANTILSETASPVTRITQGHGEPGESASSISAPEVSFKVLDNGKVERTNTRYGTVSIIDPAADYRRMNRGR